MGAKLTKNKNVSISGKNNEQQKEPNTTINDTNNHVDVSVSEDVKKTEKKIKKKKEQKLNKKTNKSRVDKSTNTERCVLASSSSSFIEQLVGDQVSMVDNNVPLNTSTTQVNAAYQPETLNKDIQALQDACVQERIISIESNVRNQQALNKHAHIANNVNIAEASTNNASITSDVLNSDHVQSEQQHQYVES